LFLGTVYYISVRAKNAVGIWSEIGTSNGIEVIQIAPSISSVTPEDGSLFEIGDIVPIAIQASDLEGDEIFYKILIDGKITRDWGSVPAFEWYTFSETTGLHEINVYARDVWNNESSLSIEVYLARKAVNLPE